MFYGGPGTPLRPCSTQIRVYCFVRTMARGMAPVSSYNRWRVAYQAYYEQALQVEFVPMPKNQLYNNFAFQPAAVL